MWDSSTSAASSTITGKGERKIEYTIAHRTEDLRKQIQILHMYLVPV
jgi:hypothetical protein